MPINARVHAEQFAMPSTIAMRVDHGGSACRKRAMGAINCSCRCQKCDSNHIFRGAFVAKFQPEVAPCSHQEKTPANGPLAIVVY